MFKTLPRQLLRPLAFAIPVADRKIVAMASAQVRESHIEVERKFIPMALLEAQLEGRYGDYERLRRLQEGSSATQQPSMSARFQRPARVVC